MYAGGDGGEEERKGREETKERGEEKETKPESPGPVLAGPHTQDPPVGMADIASAVLTGTGT